MRFSQYSWTFVSCLLALIHPGNGAAIKDISAEVGHHIIYSYPGIQPPAQLTTLIEQGKVGGIIIFGENVADNLSAIIDAFQDTYKQSVLYPGSPLLILTDQEGGEVRRLSGGPISSAKQIGQSTDPSNAAKKSGSDAAAALGADHLNGNLAPVLDIYRQAGNFIDESGRSYGNTSSIVSTCASAFIETQQGAGFIATAKHFPGLGAAAAGQNTDEEPVTINLSVDELRYVDEAPYSKAISAGIDMVMTSWALYPALDSKYPSGLSRTWVQDELRERLGFKGVTITDAIEAGALQAFGDDPSRAILAGQAGMDIILASGRNVTQGEAIYDSLLAALNDGSLSSGEFSQGTDRILSLRRKLS
ncbi:Glycoside hydrolase superfamily [Penicillium angulare]|uniref:Glycoside hydrolase superfamily n=1 Tax=Penicillium angulare TaxID=116970 RepID=UPI00254191EF|nr:Glycoside hydrolase superfamily [Penicillium angulare]KAJ5274074.1 Glycoside hydrolase superfamily [Penicillium angulare]